MTDQPIPEPGPDFDPTDLTEEGEMVASHSVETDGPGGSCFHRILLWHGEYWVVLDEDMGFYGPFKDICAAITSTECFAFNPDVSHEANCKALAQADFVTSLESAQQPDWLPAEPMKLRINGLPYLLSPGGRLMPSTSE
jgi:hypothetical protein